MRAINYSKKGFEVLSTLRWLTHLHRLSGLPSVWGSCTIASLADATAANLTALAWHSPGQLDQLQVRALRLVKATFHPASARSATSGALAHNSLLRPGFID